MRNSEAASAWAGVASLSAIWVAYMGIHQIGPLVFAALMSIKYAMRQQFDKEK